MKRIGILSDTHGYWDNRYLEYFAECDEIWHAGDIGSYDLIRRLEEFRPVKAVCGNCDGGDTRKTYPEILEWECENTHVMMTHIGGYPGKYAPGIRRILAEKHPQLFIAGHSHILKVLFDQQLNLLYINPGAAGIMGWHKVRTLIRVTISEGNFSNLEVIELSDKEKI